MSILLDLMGRLRTVKPRDLPTIPRCVLHVVADHWNAKKKASWPKVETVAAEAGCSESAARFALWQLVDAGWLKILTPATPRDSARYQVNLDGRPVKLSRVPQCGTQEPTGVPPPSTQSAAIEHPGCQDKAPRVLRGTPEALKEPPKEPTNKAPIAPAQARAGHGPSPGQVSLIDLCVPATVPPPRATKTPKAKAADLYAAAYLAGHAAAGGTLSALTDSGKRELGRAAAAHAKRGGVPIIGAELVGWIQQRAEDFRRSVPDPKYHPGKYSPTGFLGWLDAGADSKPVEPSDSDHWPEAPFLAVPVPYRPRPPDPPLDPEAEAEIAELAKLPMSELLRRQESASAFSGDRR